MAETDVESILREIRERVVAQQRVTQNSAVDRTLVAGNGSRGNEVESSSHDRSLADNLALINSYLTTTGRAWDRLPPLVSNRRGLSARIELWLKRNLKRATRWYAWEQVNFNAAVHHALRDLLSVLSAYEEEFKRLRSQLSASETRSRELEEAQAAINEEISASRRHHDSEISDQRRATELLRSVAEQRVTALETELRERVALLQEEQRVCFKQLSLETSEAAVLEDRARRKTDALLEEMQRRLDK